MAKLVQTLLGALCGFFRWIWESPPVRAFLNFLGHCIEAIAEYLFWATDHPYKFVLAVAVGVTVGKWI